MSTVGLGGSAGGNQDQTFVYEVLFRDPQARKNKSWPSDGIVVIKGAKATLRDENGKFLVEGVAPPNGGSLESEDEIKVGSKEVQIQDSITYRDYMAKFGGGGGGRPAAPPTQVGPSNSPKLQPGSSYPSLNRSNSNKIQPKSNNTPTLGIRKPAFVPPMNKFKPLVPKGPPMVIGGGGIRKEKKVDDDEDEEDEKENAKRLKKRMIRRKIREEEEGDSEGDAASVPSDAKGKGKARATDFRPLKKLKTLPSSSPPSSPQSHSSSNSNSPGSKSKDGTSGNGSSSAEGEDDDIASERPSSPLPPSSYTGPNLENENTLDIDMDVNEQPVAGLSGAGQASDGRPKVRLKPWEMLKAIESPKEQAGRQGNESQGKPAEETKSENGGAKYYYCQW
ncbi:hypothetical protein T439DRAFT_44304 [Meredithblackwellia eburnea MCA 4105]